MREEMLSRPDLRAAVFIGGMEGIEAEYELFGKFHPDRKRLLVPSPGGAARHLAEKLANVESGGLLDVDFATMFHSELLPVL
jgi:hypothetical protein